MSEFFWYQKKGLALSYTAMRKKLKKIISHLLKVKKKGLGNSGPARYIRIPMYVYITNV